MLKILRFSQREREREQRKTEKGGTQHEELKETKQICHSWWRTMVAVGGHGIWRKPLNTETSILKPKVETPNPTPYG